MAGEKEEMRNSDLSAQLREALNADSNEEVMSLLGPHLPGIRKPTPEEGYPKVEKAETPEDA